MLVDYHIFAIVAGFIVLDIVSGFSQACVNKTVDSSIMRQGLWHKSAYVLTIFVALLCEYSTIYMDLGFTVPLTVPVCIFICTTELVSILENIARINPDIAGTKLFDYFSQNRNRRREEDE